jgi:hypothetical protein
MAQVAFVAANPDSTLFHCHQLLANERNDIEITQRRFETSVLLVKALGGGRDASQLPQRP